MPQTDDDDFWDRYDPVTNHIDPNAAFEGAWFETFGAEEDYIFSARPEHVWTIVDVDGLVWIIAGRHLVNRIGYLLTTNEWRHEAEEYLIA